MSEIPRTPEEELESGLSRKQFVTAVGLGALAAPVVAGAAAGPAAASLQGRTEPLACTPGSSTTIAQTEGPYFKPNSPLRSNIVPAGAPGTKLTVSGRVYSRSCKPLAQVLLDFWQADNAGTYDNTGFRFRGHLFTDANGAFTLTTLVPGLYPGRTRHIHVKLQAPNRPILTTQLYFPGEPRNNTDTIYDRRLLMNVQTVPGGRTATYDFVLNVP
ncbi:dioxygenase [Streptosporangium carneum]|uniref:Dioxygenase n=1 Tax=Streptosporangium carneum TaxID=47481 RepID=A0A9W6MGK8_9ACTN|nr:dioxygenase [Streptosporangium carneum]GLK13033.1 dioxygenase [Streptosporangium carneum]